MDLIVTVSQAAARLGLSAGSIRRLADSGELRVIRAGQKIRHRLFLTSEVERFAAERQERAQARSDAKPAR